MSTTRWLIWLPVTEVILEQWNELREYFALQKSYYMVSDIARLMNNKSNKLYLVMMKTILAGVAKINFAFQQTNADITKLYSDLRRLTFSLASRILKPQAIAEVAAVADPANHLPPDNLILGSNVKQFLSVSNLNDEERAILFQTCCQCLLCLCNQLIDRMPSNLASIEKLKFLSAHLVLTKVNRPILLQLPIELAGI